MQTIDIAVLGRVVGGNTDSACPAPKVVCKGLINICGNTSAETKSAPSGPRPAPASGTPVPMPNGRP